MKTREGIIHEAIRQRSEIVQIFNDVSHWNHSVRKPDEAEIAADPDGQLAKMLTAIDHMLAHDTLVWKVWSVSEYDWWLGRSKREVLISALRFYGITVPDDITETLLDWMGGEHGIFNPEEVRVLSHEDMEAFTFTEDNGGRCTFKEEFQRRLKACPKVEQFACTEI